MAESICAEIEELLRKYKEERKGYKLQLERKEDTNIRGCYVEISLVIDDLEELLYAIQMDIED